MVQRRTVCHSLRLRRWTPRMSKLHSRPFFPVWHFRSLIDAQSWHYFTVRHLSHRFKQISCSGQWSHQASNRRHLDCFSECRRHHQPNQQMLLSIGAYLVISASEGHRLCHGLSGYWSSGHTTVHSLPFLMTASTALDQSALFIVILLHSICCPV